MTDWQEPPQNKKDENKRRHPVLGGLCVYMAICIGSVALMALLGDRAPGATPHITLSGAAPFFAMLVASIVLFWYGARLYNGK